MFSAYLDVISSSKGSNQHNIVLNAFIFRALWRGGGRGEHP